MLVERPITWSCLGLAAAIAIPEFTRLLQQPEREPQYVQFAAIIIGSIGLYLACLMAVSYYSKIGRMLRLIFWEIIGVSFSLLIGYFAYRSPAGLHRILFSIGLLCPLIALISVLFYIKREKLLDDY